MPVTPVCSQTIRDVLDDLPIGPASLHRLEYLIKSLNAPLGARESPFLFQARTGGQYDVGKPARIAEEDILRDEKFEFGEPIPDEVRVRVHKADLLTEQVHRLELALVDRIDHFVVIKALCGGELHFPTVCKARAHFR